VNVIDQQRHAGELANSLHVIDRVPQTCASSHRTNDTSRRRRDDALGRGNLPVAGNRLNVAQRAAGLVHRPSSAGDECAATRIRRPARDTMPWQTNCDDTGRRDRSAALGPDHRPRTV